jgi:uncharacterized membrane protein YsdA (DUF1294 family)/cold shock CspA family protein
MAANSASPWLQESFKYDHPPIRAMPARLKGILTQWNEARGFGFIEPAEGGNRVFCHARAFRDPRAKPSDGIRVTYELGRDDRGRPRAEDVWLSMSVRSRKPAPDSAQPHVSRSVTGSGIFAALLVTLVLLGRLTWIVLPWYLGLSLVTFIAFVRDKGAAERNRWRVTERTLQFLAVLGGWPGAWMAQQVLRHKTSKRSFQIEFWICVIVNLVVLGALIWKGGQLPSAA